jgi:hypothetical protein
MKCDNYIAISHILVTEFVYREIHFGVPKNIPFG